MSDPRYDLLILEARRWVGVKEAGDNSGEMVTMFQNWDDSPDHVPWCMAFVQYCLKQVDSAYAEINTSATKHKLKKGEHCMTVWEKSPQNCRSNKPQKGYVAIWQYYKDGKPTPSGHTGIVTGIDNTHGVFSTIEGNTSDSASVDREGDGVFAKIRSLTPQGNMKLVGFLNPWP